MNIKTQVRQFHTQWSLILAIALTLGSAATTAQAITIGPTPVTGLTLSAIPDIYADFISTSYTFDPNSGTLTLSATGYLNGSQGAVDVLSSDATGFALNATLINGVLSGGSNSIVLTDTSGQLLYGSLTDAGGDPGGSLEFLFTPISGSALSNFGSQGGILLNAVGFNGFDVNGTDESSSGSADVATPVTLSPS